VFGQKPMHSTAAKRQYDCGASYKNESHCWGTREERILQELHEVSDEATFQRLNNVGVDM